jgi:hypothetical protein
MTPKQRLDLSADLSARQSALLELCDVYGVPVGNYSTVSGEETLVYFPTVADEVRSPAVEALARYCAVTRNGDVHFVTPLYATLRGAKERAAHYISDSIFDELPVAVVDLDTGRRWDASLTAKWSRPTQKESR